MSETGDPALIGRRVAGKFLVERLLGGGAMGAVYRAKDTTLDRSVALKVMHPQVAVDPSFVKRFHREARAASRIDHPYAMRVIEFGEEPDGLLYLAMEYLEGRDLYKVIHEDWPLPEPRIADIMMKALSAMQIAHDMGVIHRDLKPENIMILGRKDDEDKDIVKVCDFGIAKITESDDESASRKMSGAKVTTQGLVVGTPEYMSPEQARGEKLDARSDLYAMGVILYQLLTGRPPFLAETALAVVLKHITENPEPPRKIYAGVHEGLEAVCMKSLLKEKTERFQSAREMRTAIRAVMDGKPIPAPAVAPTLAEMVPVTGPNPMGPSSAPSVAVSSDHVVISPASTTMGNVPPPAAPVVIASKTTPLGTSLVSDSAVPPKRAPKTALYAAVGLGAVALGVVGVVVIKPKLDRGSSPATPVIATDSVKSAEVPAPTASSATPPTIAPDPPRSATPVEEKSAHPSPPPAPIKSGVKTTKASAPEPDPVVVVAPAPAPEPAPAPAPVSPPATPPAPAPAAFNPNTCKAVLGAKRGVGGSHPQELTLNGTDAAWTACARSSIKEKPAAPIAATVRLKFSDSRAFRGATCTGCAPALNQCIAGSTARTVSVNFKSGDVTGEPDFDVPVTFTCD